MVSKIHLGLAITFALIAILFFRPVPIVKEDRALVVKGLVTHVYEGGEKDLVIRLKGEDTRYYINRGLESRFELNSARTKLIGQEVTIKYPKYWTPLDWNNRVRHLSKLELGDEVLFNELK
jgi:hypothetical protein